MTVPLFDAPPGEIAKNPEKNESGPKTEIMKCTIHLKVTTTVVGAGVPELC